MLLPSAVRLLVALASSPLGKPHIAELIKARSRWRSSRLDHSTRKGITVRLPQEPLPTARRPKLVPTTPSGMSYRSSTPRHKPCLEHKGPGKMPGPFFILCRNCSKYVEYKQSRISTVPATVEVKSSQRLKGLGFGIHAVEWFAAFEVPSIARANAPGESV